MTHQPDPIGAPASMLVEDCPGVLRQYVMERIGDLADAERRAGRSDADEEDFARARELRRTIAAIRVAIAALDYLIQQGGETPHRVEWSKVMDLDVRLVFLGSKP